MIEIIGFSEVVLLTGGMAARKEMRVRTPDGCEHGVEVPEGVVQQLLGIWVGHKRAGKATPQPRFAEPPQAAEEEDAEEVTFGGEVPPAPTAEPVARPAVPRFLSGDDDDGEQI